MPSRRLNKGAMSDEGNRVTKVVRDEGAQAALQTRGVRRKVCMTAYCSLINKCEDELKLFLLRGKEGRR